MPTGLSVPVKKATSFAKEKKLGISKANECKKPRCVCAGIWKGIIINCFGQRAERLLEPGQSPGQREQEQSRESE